MAVGITELTLTNRVTGPQKKQTYSRELSTAYKIRGEYESLKGELEKKRIREAIPVKRYDQYENTTAGVAGLTLIIYAPRGESDDWSAYLSLQCTIRTEKTKKKWGSKMLNRSRRCYDDDDAIRLITMELLELNAEARGLDGVPKEWLDRAELPSVARFRKLAAEMREYEVEVSKTFLDAPTGSFNGRGPKSTSVPGVTLLIGAPDKRWNNTHWVAYLTCPATSKSGKRMNLKRRVYNDAKAMMETFKYFAEIRAKEDGLKSVPKNWITDNPPTVARFEELAKSMRQKGKPIGPYFLD